MTPGETQEPTPPDSDTPEGTRGARAVEDLAAYARRGASGEFIGASSTLEVHVYLQAGRVAWATDSKNAFAFTRYLEERLSLSKSQLREVLEECRRGQLPLGETMIAWKLATAEQVRAALRHQIAGALSELSRLERGGQRLFLERARGFERYATELTFELGEFAGELGEPTPPPAVRAPASPQALPEQAPQIASHVPIPKPQSRGDRMATVKETLPKIAEIDGFVGACIVDSNSGMTLGAVGGNGVDLEAAAAGNTEVVRAKRKTMKALNLSDQIEDILITLGKAYHVIRPLASNEALFIYVVLDRNKSNLAMARHSLRALEKELVVA